MNQYIHAAILKLNSETINDCNAEKLNCIQISNSQIYEERTFITIIISFPKTLIHIFSIHKSEADPFKVIVMDFTLRFDV